MKLNAQDKNGKSALIYGNIEVMRDIEYEWIYFMFCNNKKQACEKNQVSVVKKLLESGYVDPNILDNDKKSAIFYGEFLDT